MKNPTTVEIVADWLKQNGYDGLYWDGDEDGCGCSIEELAPCGQIGGGCKAGYLRKGTAGIYATLTPEPEEVKIEP